MNGCSACLEAHEDHVGGELAEAGEGDAGLGSLLQATTLRHSVESLQQHTRVQLTVLSL